MGRRLLRRPRWAALTVLLLWPAVTFAQEGAGVFRQRTVYEDLQMFSQVLNQIRVNHPDSVDTHALFMAAVEGMVRAADPHSYVLPATRLSPEKEAEYEAGRLVPVPLRFRFFGGAPVVVAVHPGSSAARLDILPGDELVAVDGDPILARSEEELDIILAGAPGSTVTLSFERRRIDGSLVRLERSVLRERLDGTGAIPAAFMLPAGVGYVRISTFDRADIANEIDDALSRLERKGMSRLILDLRDNGGGRLAEAAKVAGIFLPKGAIVFTTEGRKKELTDTIRVERSFWKRERSYPIVVLVNAGTASAAELVAGALQDHDRALVVGRPTFGKSLMMQGFPMTDGSILVLVIGRVRTPCGRDIQREYRSTSTREYYRASVEERRRAGRPTCKTAGGRVVYGGGGIYPDVTVPPSDVPLWLARVREASLPLRWIPGYIEANAATLPDPAALSQRPRLDAEAMAAFRAFAEAEGVAIPDDPAALALLEDELALDLAFARWGVEGYLRVATAIDPEIETAIQSFKEAAALLAVPE